MGREQMIAIKELRKAAGLSQGDVAKALGFGTAQMVSNIENNKSFYPVYTFKRLSEIFKVDVNEVISCFYNRKVDLLEKRISEIRNEMDRSKKNTKIKSKK